MKRLLSVAVALALLAVAPLPVEAGGTWKAKVWTNDGHIWTLNHMLDRGVGGQWRYWAPGESGVLHWDDLDTVRFLENLSPWRYAPGDEGMPRGRRAEVRFNNGEVRELWIHVDHLHGRDDWGTRKIQGEDLTRIDFLSTRQEEVLRCPNGHVWHQEGYRYCPYDGEPLTAYEKY